MSSSGHPGVEQLNRMRKAEWFVEEGGCAGGRVQMPIQNSDTGTKRHPAKLLCGHSPLVHGGLN